MAWTIRFDPRAERDLKRLDRSISKKILKYPETRVSPVDEAEDLGKGLTGPLAGLWRYRVEDYCVICRIEPEVLLVLVLAAGHLKDIYTHFKT